MRTFTKTIILSFAAILCGCPACPKEGADPVTAGPEPEGSTTNHLVPVPGGCLTTSGPECNPETSTAGATTTTTTAATTAADATTTGAAPSEPSDPAPTPIPQ